MESTTPTDPEIPDPTPPPEPKPQPREPHDEVAEPAPRQWTTITDPPRA